MSWGRVRIGEARGEILGLDGVSSCDDRVTEIQIKEKGRGVLPQIIGKRIPLGN